MRNMLPAAQSLLIRIILFLACSLVLFPAPRVFAQQDVEIPASSAPEPVYHLGPQLLPFGALPKNAAGSPETDLLETNCPNSNFSQGNFTNWIGCYGYFDPLLNCQTPGFLTTGAHPLHKIIPAPGWEDVQTCYGLVNVFPGELYAARLGDTMYTSQGNPRTIPKEAELKYAVTVTQDSYLFIYRYAIILQTGGHASNIQPDFKVQITDAAGVELDPICGSYYITAQTSGPPAPGWGRCQSVPNGDVYWKAWTTVGMDLTPYYGQTVYLNFKVRGCTYDTHFGYAYISSYCSALAIQIGLCAGSPSATLTAPPGFQSYEWRGPGYFGPVIGTTPSIIIGSPQAGDLYYCNLTAVNGCTVNDLSQQISFTVITSDFTSIANCAGQPSQFTDASTINQNQVVNWHWNFGDGSLVVTGVQNPTHVYATPGTYTVQLTSYSTEGCTSISSHPITIPAAPVPTLTGSNLSCVNGPNLTYTTEPGKSNYIWTIPAGATVVSGGGPNDNTVTLDWTTLGSYTLNVNYTIPTTLCSALIPTPLAVTVEAMPPPPITGDNPSCMGVAGRTYTTTAGKTNYIWTVPSQATITAGGGTGDDYVTVTWNAVGTFNIQVNYTEPVSLCIPDTPGSLSVVVNPSPTVNPVASQILCHNDVSSEVQFTGTIPGTEYTWTNSNLSIGLAASGTGDIPSFTVTNTGNAPETATVTITPTYTNAGLTCTGPDGTFTITVNPIPVADIPASQVLCPGATTAAVNFTGNVAGSVYNWTNDNITIGLAPSGTGNIAPFPAANATFAPVTANLAATPSYTNLGTTCTGSQVPFTITVNPQPTVDLGDPQILCHTMTSTLVQFSGDVPATVFNWTNNNPTIGLAASGTGDIAAFPVSNTTTVPQVATVTVTPSFTNAGSTCTGTPDSFDITVNPIPSLNPVTGQVLCHDVQTALVNFTADVAGTTFSWTNDNTAIGLPAIGTGDILPFTATNTTTGPLTANITVTPSFPNAGIPCVGTPSTFTITVNPIPTVNSVSGQVLCNNTAANAIAFSGVVPGTIFDWTNNNTSIGLAAGGSGDITAFTAINTGTAPVTATISVTPSFTWQGMTCTGIPVSFDITVNPTPSVNAVASQALCHLATTAAVTLSGNVPGTVYNWVNNNTSIGLSAGGTGDIAAFQAINGSAAPVTANITVTPTFTYSAVTCTGLPTTFDITVNPLPVPTITGPGASCLNIPATYITEDLQSGYTWNVLSGGVINTGQSTRQIDVTWNTIGTHFITVNYTDPNGCTSLAPSQKQVVVNSLPVPTITGAALACTGETKTYTTQTGATTYAWTLPASGITLVSGGGVSDDQVTVAWNAAGAYAISVNYTIGTGCTAVNPTSYPVTVNATPSPVITGPAPVCALSTHNYTLNPVVAGHAYNWTVSGGTIQAGQTASIVQVLWGSSASGSLNLTETISYPGITCSAPATSYPVILDPWPVAAGAISGSASVCKTSTMTYSVPPILNATSYQWTYSGSGVTITNNGTSTISISFSPASTGGALTVKGINNCGSGALSAPLNIAVHNLPEVAFNPCFDLVTTQNARKFVLRGGTPYLPGQGVYSGSRVSLNLLTGHYEFDPFGAPVGNYAVTYSFSNTYGCLASSATVTISVMTSSFSCGGDLTDVRDNKKYKTAYLSGRCWMTENLKYGNILPSPGPAQTDNCIPEKYCAPADATCSGYGGLYQWDEVMDYAVNPGTRGMCPPEWHVPTEAEWQSLIDNLVSGIGAPMANALAASTMKDLLLFNGFHALTSGINYHDNYWAFATGSVTGTLFWTSSVSDATHSVARGLNLYNPSISLYSSSRGNAFSLRCIKD